MKVIVLAVCLSVIVETTYGRLSKDQMRLALNRDPMFSHKRESAVPMKQNVNIHLPINDPDIPPAWGRPSNRPHPQPRPETAGSDTIGMGVPVRQEVNVRPSVAAVKPPPRRNVRPVVAGKPVRQQEMILGQVKPTKVSEPQPTKVPARPPVRVQPSSASKPKPAVQPSVQPEPNSETECAFHIPTFLLPDPNPSNVGSSLKCPSFLVPGPTINPELVNLMIEHWTGIKKPGTSTLNGVKSQITQVEFEQKCLLPALRAHLLGGKACKTRALKVYLEWLLYLRQRLFNI